MYNDICFYLKFYEKEIDKISEWEYLLEQIFDFNIKVYIWIESNKSLDEFNIPYKDKINYITHFNKTDYNNNIITYEDNIRYFCSNIGIISGNINYAQAHLKSFLLPSEEFIVHLDGDDMFYDDLQLQDILNVIQYMKDNNKKILARPYWITYDRGWSFGFVIQRKSLLDIMFIFNPDDLPSQYKNNEFKKKICDFKKICNLDNYFGMILTYYHNIDLKDLFFYFKNFPYWINARNPKEKYIDYKITKIFCEHNNIIAL